MTKVIKLGALALAVQPLAAATAAVPAPIHHIISIDVSGSMYGDLPGLRTHLKNRLATVVGEQDTVSIIWFSGRGQCGTLVKAMKIRNVADLSALHTAIDRYLTPTGLTGFKEPLQEASKLIDELRASASENLINLFFMSDGYDNQSSEKDVLDLCGALAAKVDSAVVVEYGWHCNRPLLSKMAEALGGKQIFSEEFSSYVSAFEGSLTGSTKRVPVALEHPPVGPVFAVVGTSILAFTPDAAGVVSVPEGLSALGYQTTAPGEPFDFAGDKPGELWAFLAQLASRGDANGVFEALGAIGDVALVNQFSNCFSKEDYSRFQEAALAASADPALRYVDGFDPSAVPNADAYTVMHLLAELTSSDANLFYPYHPSFAYERIGAASKQDDPGVHFVPADKAAGYPISGVVWNETRPNVSLRVKVPGSVTLPTGRPSSLPAAVDTFIYRNYTIIRDGIVHTRQMPVSLGKSSFDKLQAQGLLKGEDWAEGKVFELTFPKLPVINRNMVKSVTAADTFSAVLDLLRLKAEAKVFNDWRKQISPKTSDLYLMLYGEDATGYLADLGLTTFNGFNPSSKTVPSGDYYMATELKIAAKGLSSFPKVGDVESKLAAGVTSSKLKISEFLMAPAVARLAKFMASPVYADAPDSNDVLASWLETESKALVDRTRAAQELLAGKKFAIVVGHTWFSDLPTFGEGSLEVEVAGFGKVAVTATLKEVQIAL